jgi:hypothetical protein
MPDSTNKYLIFDEPFLYRDGIFKLVTGIWEMCERVVVRNSATAVQQTGSTECCTDWSLGSEELGSDCVTILNSHMSL